MKFLKMFVFVGLPVLLLINLSIFAFNDASLTNIFGFKFLKNYIGTYNGLTLTLDTIHYIQEINIDMSNTPIVDWDSFWLAVGNFFIMFGVSFSIPFQFIIDVVSIIIWLLTPFNLA